MKEKKILESASNIQGGAVLNVGRGQNFPASFIPVILDFLKRILIPFAAFIGRKFQRNVDGSPQIRLHVLLKVLRIFT